MGYRVVKTVKAQLFDVPIFGTHFQKIGRVIDLWADPCRPDPIVWVYAFWQAIPTFAASITKPDLIDIDIAHRRGKPRKGVKNRFISVGESFDQLITVNVPRWVPFRLWEIAQRIGWYFLVADATEQGAINWISLAYRYNGCQTDLLKYVDAINDHRLQHASTGPGNTVVDWNTVGASGINWDGHTAKITWPGKYRIQWYLQFEPYVVPSQSELPYTTYISVDGVIADVGEIGTYDTDKAFASGGLIIEYDGGFPQPEIQIMCGWAQGTGFCYMTGKFDISRTTDTELSPDP